MTDIVLVLSRAPEQQAAFDEFVAAQYDSSSPNFHHWLQPAEVGEHFGPSLADIATISNWLASHSLSVAAVSKDRMSIRCGGTAAQVEGAFHTEIHNLSVNGERHIANISDPQIPAALAPVVLGVKALHDFKPKPLHRLGSKVTFDSATGKWQRIAGALPITSASAVSALEVTAHPDFGITVGSGSSAYLVEDVAPYDFATIYNVLPLWAAATPITGTGQTIAIAGTSDITLADVATFRSAFGLPAGLTPLEVEGANGLDPGICTSTSPTATCTIDDLTENSLDVEWSGAVAPGAQIVLVTSGSQSATDDTVYDSSSYVVENVGVSSTPVANAHILSVSYGACELAEGTAGNAAYNNLWQTAATEGIAVFVATGDAGSATCDQGQGGTSPSYRAEYGVSVSGLASTPYDTAVGGTDLNWGLTASPYWSATNNSTNGASAMGYVPEVPWNDTCTNPIVDASINSSLKSTLTATQICDEIFTGQITSGTDETGLRELVNSIGGGGGVSACTTSDGQTVASCTGGYAKPSWQANVTGIPADGKRDLPDVSFFASNGFLGSAYLICVSANGACTYTATTEPTAQEVGGTSVATPAMAGAMALINQKAGAPQGNPNAELYSLAAKQNYANCSTETVTAGGPCYFNDIDTGTNAMPCDYSDKSPNCTGTNEVGILSGYSATAGFDPATGLGSLNVANVVNGWTAPATSTETATVQRQRPLLFPRD
jgi:subtilase family serine protease